jgi:ankyrin repeat protein
LQFAVIAGHLSNVEALLGKGAKFNLRDSSGKSVLDHAEISKNTEMIALLKEWGAS